jgi:hypothetical protein
VLYCQSAEANFRTYYTFLLAHYEMRQLGELKWILSIRVNRNASLKTLLLCQDYYIANIASTSYFDALLGYSDTPHTTNELRSY